MKQLYVAWRDPEMRRFHTVGLLTNANGRYQFRYTQGAQDAANTRHFAPFPSFPDLRSVYEDVELFPLFANRVMPRSRRDYAEYVEWLALPQGEDDPMALLMRSGGRSATDTLELYPCPERTEDGDYHLHFFVHGVRYMTAQAQERMEILPPQTRLALLPDMQNRNDWQAFLLRTDDDEPDGTYLVGYCPRYLCPDLWKLLTEQQGDPRDVVVQVERVNPPPAPMQMRLLCCITMRWPARFTPFSDAAHQPLVAEPPASTQREPVAA